MRAQPCDAGYGGDIGVPVHGEAAQEVARVVEDPVEPPDLAIDVPGAERSVARRAGRGRDDQRDLAAAHDEQHLPCLVDLDVVAAVAGRRGVRGDERRPQRCVDAAGPREPLHLLERVDRLESSPPK